MNRRGAHFSAFGGYLADLYRLLRFDVRNPHGLSKLRIIDAARRKTGARTFIETGTFRGVTAARCAKRFEKVITVELDPKLAADAKLYLSRWPNIEAIEGDGLKEMPRILARDDVRDALVYLDGHFSEGITAKGDMDEPAVEEIPILAQYRDKVRAVIVDDFRCFGVNDGWPSKWSLVKAVEESFGKDFDITVHMDQLMVTRRR